MSVPLIVLSVAMLIAGPSARMTSLRCPVAKIQSLQAIDSKNDRGIHRLSAAQLATLYRSLSQLFLTCSEAHRAGATGLLDTSLHEKFFAAVYEKSAASQDSVDNQLSRCRDDMRRSNDLMRDVRLAHPTGAEDASLVQIANSVHRRDICTPPR